MIDGGHRNVNGILWLLTGMFTGDTLLMYKFFCRKHNFLGPEWRYCAYSRIHQMDDQPVRLKAFNEADQGSSLSSNSNHNGGSNKR